MRRSAIERYENDPAFAALVNMFYAAIEDNEFTPTEIREAAIVAAMKYETLHVRSLILSQEEWDKMPTDMKRRLGG